MYRNIEAKFNEALAKGKLVFTPSTEYRSQTTNGVPAIYTLTPALSQKPSPPKQSLEKKSPWLPPDEDLVVEKLGRYLLVLNKFAVAKYHFLLVTSEHEPQTGILSEEDWNTSLEVLRKADSESGKRHVGFYNCGLNSGASIDHKHIQFLTLPENFSPFPDTTPNVTPGTVVNDKRLPFEHFIVGIEDGANGDTMTLRYAELLGQTMTRLAKSELPLSYNVVFTQKWLLITPRTAEKTDDGISINSLGTIGLILAKSESQLEIEKKEGFNILKQLTLPYEMVIEEPPDHTGYTRY